MMEAFRVVLLVVDHDGLGMDAIKKEIENVRYPNRCINPSVMLIQGVDIGEWEDANPLNFTSTQHAEFHRIFPDGG